jgi:hypothetical protein
VTVITFPTQDTIAKEQAREAGGDARPVGIFRIMTENYRRL